MSETKYIDVTSLLDKSGPKSIAAIRQAQDGKLSRTAIQRVLRKMGLYQCIQCGCSDFKTPAQLMAHLRKKKHWAGRQMVQEAIVSFQRDHHLTDRRLVEIKDDELPTQQARAQRDKLIFFRALLVHRREAR